MQCKKKRFLFCFKKLADILLTAAEDGGLVDPDKIKQILKVPNKRSSQGPSGLRKEETFTGSCFLSQCHQYHLVEQG